MSATSRARTRGWFAPRRSQRVRSALGAVPHRAEDGGADDADGRRVHRLRGTRRLGSVTRSSMMETEGALTFESVPSGTRMCWSWDVRPRGAMKLMAPFVGPIGRSRSAASGAASNGCRSLAASGGERVCSLSMAAGSARSPISPSDRGLAERRGARSSRPRVHQGRATRPRVLDRMSDVRISTARGELPAYLRSRAAMGRGRGWS